MRKHARVARLGVFVAALGLVLTACGGSSTPKAIELPTTSDSTLHPSTIKGGTLRPLNDTDCDYWDPVRTYYANCWDQQRWFSRQLVTYAPKPGPAELVPDLATAVPTSADLKTWKYTLKSGVRFEDGAEITSKDIKYAVERQFATDVINGGPTYFVDFLDDPNNPYPGPYKDTSADKLGLSSVETPDDKTIIFHLNKPFGDWNYVMSLPSITPVPKAADTGDKYNFHPVSSGPYKFEKYVPGKSLTLVRNPQWDPATDQVNKALPDRIEETMGLDLVDIDNRILANTGDFYVGQTGVQTAVQTKLINDKVLRDDRATVDLTGFLRYLVVTTTVKPFDNIHCRKAVAWAIDKQAQVLARGGPAGGEVAPTMITPPIKYFSSFNLYPSSDSRGDIGKAKDELKACGHPDGFTTKLASRKNGKEVKQAEAVQAALKQIGINLTIDTYDPSQYYSAQLGIPKNMQAKGYGLAMAAWGPDWPSPYAFLGSIVDGRKILAQGNSNYAELNSSVVNAALDAGSAATSDAVAQKEWTTADKAIVDSAAYVPLVYDKAMNLYSNRVTNIHFTPAYLMADFAQFGVVRAPGS
jgi:peptide/nickel transport system substrate-binding protein